MQRTPRILWADDEIDLLKPHILFLEGKGFHITPVNSGVEALERLREEVFDLVFLDEQMPGLNGIETLQRLKEHRPHLPVIMITKSEEEHIMEEAIGSKISDYLIKPVNPNQILLAIKKNLDEGRLISEKAMSDYQREFRDLSMQLMGPLSASEWASIFRRLVHWKLELEKSEDDGMKDILEMQYKDANRQFGKFYEQNYAEWMAGPGEGVPLLSHRLLPERLPRVWSELKDGQKVYLVVIDNLRFDQWKMIEPLLLSRFDVVHDETYYSMLPTATQYARNALFAGLSPAEIARVYPQFWIGEDEEGSKNKFEGELLSALLNRMDFKGKSTYHKVANLAAGKRFMDQFHQTKDNDFTAVVYNFVDMLSHARTEMEVLKELAEDEAAYRSLTLSWFEHSALKELLGRMADQGARVIITTDHGTVRVNNPIKVKGERSTNTNLRYKVGRNLGYDGDDVFELRDPEAAGLPRPQVSSAYIFAREDDFLVYPNNYNHFAQYFRDTFQHGGISLEEVIIPWIELDPN
ncbi:MAG: bifunctional response regulator/alkaline phosphatase family protein [Bacteroidetes bacterium]|nr:bifunctional response regulator/alkaline phosphatase family protein [Bacteroidota bacterium]